MKIFFRSIFLYCVTITHFLTFSQKTKANISIIRQIQFCPKTMHIIFKNHVCDNHKRAFFWEKALQNQSFVKNLNKNFTTNSNKIYTKQNNHTINTMYRTKQILFLTDKVTYCAQIFRINLTALNKAIVIEKLQSLQKIYKSKGIIRNTTLALLILIIQYAIILCTNKVYKQLQKKIKLTNNKRLKPIFIKNYEFLNIEKQVKIILFLLKILKFITIIMQLLLSIPGFFKIFPQTEKVAVISFYYIWNPIKKIGIDIAHYIPNIFTIIIIWTIFRYIIKGLRTLAEEIEKEQLKLPGFYTDWAKPTFNIIRFLLYAFMTALIYPHLPHSESEAFKSVSVLIGLIFSIGSSSAISNLVAGIIITYMRPFKIGDMIKINDVMGNVIEKTQIATRVLTIKNEIITFPNTTIINAQTVNLSESARTNGLILHFDVTFGYDTPWRIVHKILLDSAESTQNILKTPHPFVLETNFNDFHITYQINVYIKDANKMLQIFSELRQNVQDKFNEAGISMLSIHYHKQDVNIKRSN